MIRNLSLKEKVCESFFANNLQDAIKITSKINAFGELRFDMSNLEIKDLSNIKKLHSKPLIFTCRKGKLTEELRLQAYLKAIELNFKFIDLDISHDLDLFEQVKTSLMSVKTKLIISYHDYQATRSIEELKQVVKQSSLCKPDIIKIVSTVNSNNDIEILENLQKEHAKTICFGMGSFATESRIRSLRNGGDFTYVAYDKKKGTANGQIDYHDFEKAYTKYRGVEKVKLAVIGNPIIHSKSPQIFNMLFNENNVQGVYEKLELSEVSEFLEISKYYDGFNITAPFKQSIIAYLDKLSGAAQKIGAVNTIFKKNGLSYGDNTDFIGILKAIDEYIPISTIKNCLILGSGGAAKAAAYAMSISNIPTTICNRTHTKAEQLAQDYNQKSVHKNKLHLQDYHLIINTTPQPFHLINNESLQKEHVVLDAIYHHSYFAKEQFRSFILIEGEKWLNEQAKAAYKLFIP